MSRWEFQDWLDLSCELDAHQGAQWCPESGRMGWKVNQFLEARLLFEDIVWDYVRKALIEL